MHQNMEDYHMNSLEARFDQLEVFLNEDSDKRTRFRGVPYFIFPYEPQYERKILSEVDRLEQ